MNAKLQAASRSSECQVTGGVTLERMLTYSRDVSITRVDHEQIDGNLLSGAVESQTFVEVAGRTQVMYLLRAWGIADMGGGCEVGQTSV